MLVSLQLHGSVTLHHVELLLACQQALARYVFRHTGSLHPVSLTFPRIQASLAPAASLYVEKEVFFEEKESAPRCSIPMCPGTEISRVRRRAWKLHHFFAKLEQPREPQELEYSARVSYVGRFFARRILS